MKNNHSNCIFCQIAIGQAPSHQLWSSETHLAFLSIFPNTEGFTVVIPKKHLGSYAFEQTDADLTELIIASKKVAQLLDSYYDDVARCGMFFEGYGVDHLHAKLFPMHGTGSVNGFAEIEDKNFDTYFEQYPGYLCSNNSRRADDATLASLASSIREFHKSRTQ